MSPNAAQILVAAVVALAVTLVFLVALRPAAIRLGLVDRPGGRKRHIGLVPIIGGAAMVIGIGFGTLLLSPAPTGLLYMLACGLLLTVVGILDDKYAVPAAVRLVAQVSSVLLMVFGGNVVMTQIGDPLWIGDIGLGFFALPVTLLITISVINSFNFVDGSDGLAGTLALIALAAVLATGGLTPALAGICVVTMAAVAAFLVFNLPLPANRPIRTFMGDAGSTMLGMIIAWLTISVSQGEARVISPVTGLWFAAIPIFDFFTCFVRRLAKGKSPFRPGRNHFHHVLYRAGLDSRQVLAVLAGLGLAYALAGLAGHYFGVADSLMFTLWAILGLGQYRMLKRFAMRSRRTRIRGRQVGR